MEDHVAGVGDIVRVADAFMGKDADAKSGLRLHKRPGDDVIAGLYQLGVTLKLNDCLPSVEI